MLLTIHKRNDLPGSEATSMPEECFAALGAP